MVLTASVIVSLAVGLVAGFVWRGFLRVDYERNTADEFIEADGPLAAIDKFEWSIGDLAIVKSIQVVHAGAIRKSGQSLWRVDPTFSHVSQEHRDGLIEGWAFARDTKGEADG